MSVFIVSNKLGDSEIASRDRLGMPGQFGDFAGGWASGVHHPLFPGNPLQIVEGAGQPSEVCEQVLLADVSHREKNAVGKSQDGTEMLFRVEETPTVVAQGHELGATGVQETMQRQIVRRFSAGFPRRIFRLLFGSHRFARQPLEGRAHKPIRGTYHSATIFGNMLPSDGRDLDISAIGIFDRRTENPHGHGNAFRVMPQRAVPEVAVDRLRAVKPIVDRLVIGSDTAEFASRRNRVMERMGHDTQAGGTGPGIPAKETATGIIRTISIRIAPLLIFYRTPDPQIYSIACVIGTSILLIKL